MACAQSYCTEAARAAALASHSAASLAAAAGFREAARLLRSSEALARAATAALLALPRPEVRGPGPAVDGDATKAKKKRSQKKKGKKVAMEGVTDGSAVVLPRADGVPEAISTTTTSKTLSSAATEFVPGRAARVLVARNSRERSPYGARAPSSASPSSSTHHGPLSALAGTVTFAVGQAVALLGLASRADLLGKRGVVKFFDAASSRYAVCIDVTGEMVRVRAENLQASVIVLAAELPAALGTS
jgi:hypothetical protein